MLAVITLGLGIGYLGHLLGLSYALGAFIAGLVLSESDYGHQALSDVIPLRDLFGLLFFATVGILLDPVSLVDHAVQVLVLSASLIVGKGLLFGAITRSFGYRYIVPLATALTMGQTGEFSFLLAQVGRQAGAVGEALHSLVVSTAVATMVLTPYLARAAGPLYGLQRRLRRNQPPPPTTGPDKLEAPILVAGAGRVGRAIARVLAARGLGLVLIDFDIRRVADARAEGLAGRGGRGEVDARVALTSPAPAPGPARRPPGGAPGRPAGPGRWPRRRAPRRRSWA